MNKDNLIKGLSEEQIAKVKACRSHEELLELAKQEGIELSEEQLQAVNGGGCTSEPPRGNDLVCPKCGSTKTGWTWYPFIGYDCTCGDCGHTWSKK